MKPEPRIEQALIDAIEPGVSVGCPPLLADAIRYAVFPGGARVRPRLCLAVARACGEDHPSVVNAASASIELLHCASLVHDDLPCFDDAMTRRGKPSLHRAFDERLAVLTGDAMIVLAFELLASGCRDAPQRLPALAGLIARSIGPSGGIIAGQAWECEPKASLAEYQQAKTGSLFAAATMAGAVAAGWKDAESWRLLGLRIGEAYQVADDVLDVVGNAAEIGKPVGRDVELGRPSAVATFGMSGAISLLKKLVLEATESVPACVGSEALRATILAQANNLLPRDMRQAA